MALSQDSPNLLPLPVQPTNFLSPSPSSSVKSYLTYCPYYSPTVAAWLLNLVLGKGGSLKPQKS
jgi:hypothetical protein